MFLSVKNVNISGVTGAVPDNFLSVDDMVKNRDKIEALKIKRTAMLAGLQNRAVAQENVTAGDLVVKAGNYLLEKLCWEPNSVSSLIFVTQTPDFLMPGTSYLIHDGLKLSSNCFVTDITASCSGLIHGIAVASKLLSAENPRALVCAGDTISKTFTPDDIGNQILFGDGVGVIALEYDINSINHMKFNITAYPDSNLDLVYYGSGERKTNYSKGFYMRGDKIMEFSQTKTLENIFDLLEESNIDFNEIETFFFHQPNLMLLDLLCKKLNLSKDKVPTTISEYGNCSSANIALLLSEYFKDRSVINNKNYFLCGFGGGLEVASLVTSLNCTKFFDVIRV